MGLLQFFLLFSHWKKIFREKSLESIACAEGERGGVRVVIGGSGIGRPVIDGNWKFDWQVFDVVVVDLKLAARRRQEMTGRV